MPKLGNARLSFPLEGHIKSSYAVFATNPPQRLAQLRHGKMLPWLTASLLTTLLHATLSERGLNMPSTTGGTTGIFQPRNGAISTSGAQPLLQPLSSTSTRGQRKAFAKTSEQNNRGNRDRKQKTAVYTNGVDASDQGNGKKLSIGKEYHQIHDPVGSGWQLFQFGSVREEANPSFAFKSTHYVRLRITDLYYNGDRFAVYQVYNNIDPELIVETPHVDSDSTQRRCTDPNAAFKSVGIYSHAEFILAPGKYHIVIKPRSSPFGGGTGAIRFDYVESLDTMPVGLVASTAEAELCSGYGGYVVVRQRVKAENQQNVCQLNGLLAVDMDTTDRDDVKAVTKTVYTCSGRNHVVWLNAVDGETKKGRLGVRITDDSELQIERRDPDERHQVLCLSPDYA